MSEAQALIDDIAAEYPELSRDDDQDQTTLHDDLHTASLQLEHDELAGGEEEHQGTHDDGVDALHVVDDDEGEHGQPDMSGLTDEALRQFANAAAMHYELNNGQDGGRDDEQDKGMHHEVDHHQSANDYVDPSLSQVVSGSIPPPPRPTYQTTHSPSLRLDPADLASLHDPTPQPPTNSTSHKRKRGTSFIATEQPLQAQGDPSKKHRTNESNLDPALGGGDDPLRVNQDPIFDVSRTPMHVAPDSAPAPPATTTGRGKRGPGARVRSQGAEEMLGMTDGGAGVGEGSDGGRKEGKDERSQRRAEQNRRAQQNFRKRREEQMKLQEARLKELEPQMEAMQRQQAETHLLLEALKLENTALRAVLVHSVKQGARILDPSGELVGASASLGLAGINRDPEVIPTDENAAATSGDAPGEDEMTSEETARAVEEVHAALDRLGARTHVYARTIVPLATDEHSAPTANHNTTHTPGGARNLEISTLNGPMIAQSSMRTVQHPQQPLQQQPIPTSAHQQPPQPFPTSNLPPFPVRPEPQHEQQQPMDMAEIDPSLENSHQGEGLMDLNLA